MHTGVSCYVLYPGLVRCCGTVIEGFQGSFGNPEEIAVVMDPVIVDGEICADVSKDTNDIPTDSSLESNGTEGEATRGDPVSMCSWISYHCIVGKFSSVCLL